MLKQRSMFYFLERFPMFTYNQVTLKGLVGWTSLNQFIKFWKGEREDLKTIKGVRRLWLKGGSSILNFWSIRIPKSKLGSGKPVGSSRCRAQILCAFCCKSKRLHSRCRVTYTYIHTHVIGNVSNYVGCSLKVSKET